MKGMEKNRKNRQEIKKEPCSARVPESGEAAVSPCDVLFCAPHFDVLPQTLPLQLTRPRRPQGTQKVLLSAAAFLP